MKPLPLLMLRPPSKALVAESPNAHMQDFELSSMSQALYRHSCHPHGMRIVCFSPSQRLPSPVPIDHYTASLPCFEQARAMSSYVAMSGISSMIEERSTTGFSFLGFGNRKTTVCSRK
mgnify:CR=1 FL=1|tara:strand:+ start:437 stop:790 length:354 start_codon:yes stop_codon:yes gene_type:complete